MQKAVIAGNVIAFLEADKALDEAIAATADNPFAARVAAPLQTHSRRFWFRYQSDTGLAAAAERHVALIRAILDGDADGAGDEAGQLIALCGYAEARDAVESVVAAQDRRTSALGKRQPTQPSSRWSR